MTILIRVPHNNFYEDSGFKAGCSLNSASIYTLIWFDPLIQSKRFIVGLATQQRMLPHCLEAPEPCLRTADHLPQAVRCADDVRRSHEHGAGGGAQGLGQAERHPACQKCRVSGLATQRPLRPLGRPQNAYLRKHGSCKQLTVELQNWKEYSGVQASTSVPIKPFCFPFPLRRIVRAKVLGFSALDIMPQGMSSSPRAPLCAVQGPAAHVVTCWAISLTSTPSAAAALNRRAPSQCTGSP